MSQELTESEFELALAAQQAELEAKVALADHEIAYQGMRSKLIAQVEAASSARQAALRAIIQVRGLNPGEWRINLTEQSLEPLRDSVVSQIEEVMLGGNGGQSFRSLDSDDDMLRARGSVATVRLTKPSNGGSGETH